MLSIFLLRNVQNQNPRLSKGAQVECFLFSLPPPQRPEFTIDASIGEGDYPELGEKYDPKYDRRSNADRRQGIFPSAALKTSEFDPTCRRTSQANLAGTAKNGGKELQRDL